MKWRNKRAEEKKAYEVNGGRFSKTGVLVNKVNFFFLFEDSSYFPLSLNLI